MSTPDAPVKRTPAWKLAVNVLILLVLVGVFARQLSKDWPEITSAQWHLDWGFAVAGLVLFLVCTGLDIAIWNRVLGWFTTRLPYGQAAPVFIWSYIARYIPGKVFSLIARMALAAEFDRPPVPVLAASVVEMALRTASALLIFLVPMLTLGITLPHEGKLAFLTGLLPLLPYLFGVLVALALIGTHPRIMIPVTNFVLRKAKRAEITRALSYGEVLALFGMLVLRWLLYGTAFVLLLFAFTPKAANHLIALFGTAAGTWAVGFIIPSPGGLGITELSIRYVLTTLHFDVSIADIFPLALRLLTLVGEGLWALAAWGLWRAMRGATADALPADVTPAPPIEVGE
jgi:uncharacterized membrane protein YbhN (UPF0104 family)